MAPFTISAGDVAVIIAILGAIFRLEAMRYTLQQQLAKYAFEHEMLLGDYCARHNMNLHDLPTRSRR